MGYFLRKLVNIVFHECSQWKHPEQNFKFSSWNNKSHKLWLWAEVSPRWEPSWRDPATRAGAEVLLSSVDLVLLHYNNNSSITTQKALHLIFSKDYTQIWMGLVILLLLLFYIEVDCVALIIIKKIFVIRWSTMFWSIKSINKLNRYYLLQLIIQFEQVNMMLTVCEWVSPPQTQIVYQHCVTPTRSRFCMESS